MPIAASPATPAPATRTLAGGTLPAAVTWPVKNRPNRFAASITARYPAMFAIELSTSSDWAREIRGTASIASTVIRRPASWSTSSGCRAGPISASRTAPSGNRAISSVLGAFTFRTTSASQARALGTTPAPASA